MPRYIADSYLYRAIGADINGACGKCGQSRSDCMCHSLSRMDICGIIEDAPTADVVERKRGKWKVYNVLDYAQRPSGRKVGKCPFCGFLTDEFRTIIEANAKLTNFCPNCGAEMKGENDDEFEYCSDKI